MQKRHHRLRVKGKAAEIYTYLWKYELGLFSNRNSTVTLTLPVSGMRYLTEGMMRVE